MMPIQHLVETPYMVGPVHCYTVELGGELVLFDTGPPTDIGRQFIKDHIDLKRLKHVIVTHCHIDHYGQSSWLEENSEATIYLPYLDILKIKRHDERLEKMYAMLSDMGFQDNYLETLHESFYRGVLFPPFPKQYLTAELDIPVHFGLEVLNCSGHSQSDLVYVGADWAVTGDTLLRNIFQSPLLDVDLEKGGRFNNYKAYCKSIVKLSGLQGKTILPGHRFRIESVDATILFYVSKMLDRVRQLKPYLGRHSVAGVIREVFSNKMKDPFHIYLKASEIVFMKDFLHRPDKLQAALEKIHLFRQVDELFHTVTKS